MTIKKRLTSGAVFSVSGESLAALSSDAEVDALSGDAVVQSQMALTRTVTGADAAWAGAVQSLGSVDGKRDRRGDHRHGHRRSPGAGGSRGRTAWISPTRAAATGDDGYGHGTHIAGIVPAAASGTMLRRRIGMAPAAHLINLKVLGADGTGKVSDVIEAIDWATIDSTSSYGIRVVNLSLGMAPTQSYRDDPLCQAVERAVRRAWWWWPRRAITDRPKMASTCWAA